MLASIGQRPLLLLPVALAALGLVVYFFLAPEPPKAALRAEASGPTSVGCYFHFDMRLLRSEIPDTVGNCLENEHANGANGDMVQRTTGGLIVRRADDRQTAFTDGARTWMRGPNGVEVRNNGDRFPWEATPRPEGTHVGTPAASPAGGTPTAATGAAGRESGARTVIITTPDASQGAPVSLSGLSSLANDLSDAFLVQSLKQSGLPVSDVRAVTVDADADKLLGKPGGYTSKVAFKDHRAQKGDAAIELYADAASAKARADTLNKAGTQLVLAPTGGKVLIRLPKELSADQARSYQTWLASLKGR